LLEHITYESGNLQIVMRFVSALRQKCRDLATLPAATHEVVAGGKR
jgi:hypothetical protein